MHKAFAGNNEDKEQDYMAKLDKKERKKFKKNKLKDKIGTRDARVLTGARTVADNVSLSKLMKVSDSSKRIKKGNRSAN
jgi:hypothetical protein